MDKKKIAYIIDEKGWALENVAINIKKNADNYLIDIIPGNVFEGNMLQLFLICQEYDLIHFGWRGYLSLIDREAMRYYSETELLTPLDDLIKEKVLNKKVSFAVCDELYLEGEEKWRTEEIMKYSKNYFVSSKRLQKIYNEFACKPTTIIHDGVDLEKYKPTNLNRLSETKKLIVGWAGNSEYKDSFGNTDLKGVHNIIKPAIEQLQAEGYDVDLKMADSKNNRIKQSDMPDFYNSVDLYVCASKSEGTPLTVLEAMAMGLPVISTDVGIVSEAFGKKQSKYILEERTAECLKQNIKKLIENKNELVELSNENLTSIKKWDWKIIAKDYEKFFEDVINN